MDAVATKPGVFKENSGHFKPCLVTKTGSFSLEGGPHPAVVILTKTGCSLMEVGPHPAVFVATRPDVFKETFPAVLVATQSGYYSQKLGQP